MPPQTVFRDGPLANIRGDRLPRTAQPEPMPVRLVGGDPSQLELIEGIQGMLTSSAAIAEEMRQSTREMLVLSQRTAALLGVEGNPGRGINVDEASVATIVSQTLRSVMATTPLADPREAMARTPAPAPPPDQDRAPAPPPSLRQQPVQTIEAPGRVREQAAQARDQVQEQVRQHVEQVHQQVQAPPTAPSAPVGPPPPPTVPGAPAAAMGAPPGVARDPFERAPVETFRSTEEIRPQGVAEAQPTNWERFEAGRGMSIADIRQTVAREVGQRVSGLQFGPQLEQVEGQWRRVPTTPGTVGAPASADEVGSFRRNQQLLGGAQGFLGELSEGGGVGQALLNRLPGGVGRLAGGVGAAIAVGNIATNFVENQRATNAEWQRIVGGSNLGALRERAGSRAFEMQQTGVLGNEQAAELYRGSAEIYGADRVARDRAMDFAVEAYRDLGMTITESLEVVRVAADAGEESLSGLGKALKDVSESAVAAGGNAVEARRQFTQSYTMGVEELGLPSGVAADLAEATTNAATQVFGPDADQYDFSAMFQNPSLLMAMGHQQGYDTIGQFMAAMQGPEGAQVAAQAQTGFLQQSLLPSIQGTGALQELERFLAEEGYDPQAGVPLTTRQRERANEIALGAGMDPYFEQQRLASLGVQGVAMGEAAGTALLSASAVFNPAAEIERINQEMQRRPVGTESGEEVPPGMEVLDTNRSVGLLSWLPEWLTPSVESDEGSFFGPEGWLDRNVPEFGPIRAIADWGGRGGDLIKRMLGGGTGDVEGATDTSAGRAYAQRVQESGFRDPRIEALLEDPDQDRRFRVLDRSEDGNKVEERVVGLEEAITYYGDQLQRGEVEIAEGAEEGRTIAEVVGGSIDESLGDAPEKRIGKGQSAEEYQKERREREKEEAREGGRVLVEASPELRRFLRFLPSGAAYTRDDARYAGRQPDAVPATRRNLGD